MSYIYREEYITKDKKWVAPEAQDQNFNVKVYGGGGAGSCDGNFFDSVGGAGGGSGYMNNGSFTIPAGTEVEIEIADGGKGAYGSTATDFEGKMIGQSGGTTYFGNYISAPGGAGGYMSIGGQGGHNGGNSGQNGEGGHGSFGCSGVVNGISYSSGGGGSAIDGIGRGGSANYAQGDAGCSAGGAGCMIDKVNDSGVFKRIGSGGPGLCIISYYQKV